MVVAVVNDGGRGNGGPVKQWWLKNGGGCGGGGAGGGAGGAGGGGAGGGACGGDQTFYRVIGFTSEESEYRLRIFQ